MIRLRAIGSLLYFTFSIEEITIFPWLCNCPDIWYLNRVWSQLIGSIGVLLYLAINSVSCFMNNCTSFLLWYEGSGSSSCWSFLYCVLTSTELMGSSASDAISHVQKLGHKSWPAIRVCKSWDISDTWHEVLGKVWICLHCCYFSLQIVGKNYSALFKTLTAWKHKIRKRLQTTLLLFDFLRVEFQCRL